MELSARKFFSETVSIGATAISIGDVLRSAGWGYQLDSDNNITTDPSLDSFLGDGCTIIPSADLYVGHDQYVRDAAAAGPPRLYKGTLAPANTPYSLQEFVRGIIDADAVWIYSPSGAQDIQLIWLGA